MNIQLKRIIQLVPLLFIFVSNIIATPRNSREALRIAMSFYQKNPVSTKSILQGTSTLQLAYTCSDVATRSSDNDGYYYVFNIGNNNGFIINSVHSSEGCYSYTKEIKLGQCAIDLGAEEAEALSIAMGE